MTGVEYLSRVLNDPAADVTRRDRAAACLASIELRAGRVQVLGKKARQQLAAAHAGEGTDWQDDLKYTGSPVEATVDWNDLLKLDPHAATMPPMPPDDE
jgi:hypothetical protein